MAKGKECAGRKTDTKRLKRDLKAKKSGGNLEVKKEITGRKKARPVFIDCRYRHLNDSSGDILVKLHLNDFYLLSLFMGKVLVTKSRFNAYILLNASKYIVGMCRIFDIVVICGGN